MKTPRLTIHTLALALGLLSTLNSQFSAVAQGTAFTYQGQLNDGASPATGVYDLRFTIYDSTNLPGTVIAGPLTNVATGVSNGLFTVALDFGANFPGADRWLDIGVRTNGNGAFTTLTARQKITPTPYAITASNLSGTLPASQLSGALPSGVLAGTYTAALTLNNAANSFTGNGAGLTGLNGANLQNGTVTANKLGADVGLWTVTGNSVYRINGNVGIGTNNPQSVLHVVGMVTASGGINEPPAGVIPMLGMVWLKPGTFIMGSRAGEPGRNSDEGPQTTVTLTKGFWMGVHEVTQSEYQTVMGSNPSHFTGDLNRPMEQLSWNNATNYCGLLTQSERTAGRVPVGWGYRLPTEAEWEYACRAGPRTTRFGYGDDLSGTILTNYAWFSVNSGNTTHPVEQKLGNPWGLMDMHGNVWEWCQDWYGTYSGGSVTDPQGPGTGSFRVIRGGSWFDIATVCRSARRAFGNPAYSDYSIGFRVVLAPGQP